MTTAWNAPMPDDQFQRLREILEAPSPIGFEAAMTFGVLKPMFESFMPDHWAIHTFRGNPGIVVDTAPGRDDLLTVMLIGHADKIRMQVRSIGEDGKVWINSDSFLPQTLIGHEVKVFSEHPEKPGDFRVLRGGTVEALGAIHFADAATRSGERGIKPTQLYLELHAWGENKKKAIEEMGIQAGDPILLDRPIKRGVFPDTFYGPYLDNGLGCFVTEEIARVLAQESFKKVRVLYAIAAWEEIGRFGSRVFAGEFKPDVLIGIDVNHDYVAAPGIGDRRMPGLEMSKGFTLDVGAITASYLNTRIAQAAKSREIPLQRSPSGRDTGTDGMAAVLASVDAASTSIGFPIRNMHTISESGHTSDVLAAIHGIAGFLRDAEKDGLTADSFRQGHPRFDDVGANRVVMPAPEEKPEES